MIRLIRKLLEENKKVWSTKLIYALWADRISAKKSIGVSPFELVYGIDAMFPVSLSLPVMNLLQDEKSKVDPWMRRINQLIEVHQKREEVFSNTQLFQNRMNKMFDRKTKPTNF